MGTDKKGLYICMLSVHGLLRGEEMELGRDPDTGGQIKYVVDLARELSRREDVERIDILTRRVIDKRVDDAYAEPEERIADKATIVRIPAGPRRYLRKESLWPYVDSFVDHTLRYFRKLRRVPNLIHGHYADAGYVGAQLARLLGIPFFFTGHSLGRVKRARLLSKGVSERKIAAKYKIYRRIEAEETALDTADRVVTSTHQEANDQYVLYDKYTPEYMRVIPPGVDLDSFRPAQPGERPPIAERIDRFLIQRKKPSVLAMARPDERKNFETLVRAFGENEGLRQIANLVLVMGNRHDLRKLEPGSRRVLRNVLYLIDLYDLYGSVACPKWHNSREVPELYRWVADRGGVFVNPALTEPFGLTLIESAASGLPVVATRDGGPVDIIGACHNGVLIDPLDVAGMGETILKAIKDRKQWRLWSQNGLAGSREHYSWESHVQRYLDEIYDVLGESESENILASVPNRLPEIDRILVTDVDNTLFGDPEGLERLKRVLNQNDFIGFAIATGRSFGNAKRAIKQAGLPDPDILITSVGTEIHYGSQLREDLSWQKHIDYMWEPEAVYAAMDDLPGIYRQRKSEYGPFKISFDLNAEEAPEFEEIRCHLREAGLRVKCVFSHQTYLDIIPIRASAGLAIRHLAFRWNIEPERLLVAGDSGNDADMLAGDTLGVVVGNYSSELEYLKGQPRIYFASGEYAWGVLEGVEHYNFTGEIHLGEEEEEEGVCES